MHLLDVLFARQHARRRAFHRRGDVRLPLRVPAAQQPLRHLAKRRHVELTRNRQNGVIRAIVLFLEHQQRLAADGSNLLMRAENRARQRMLAEIRLRQQIIHQILRRVLAHSNFLQNNAALLLKLRLVHARVEQHIAEQIHRPRQMLGDHLRVVAGTFLGGKRIHLSAQRIHLHGDVLRRAALRALEQDVLDEVRKAVLLRAFIHGSRADPQPDADGWEIFDRLGNDPQTVGKHELFAHALCPSDHNFSYSFRFISDYTTREKKSRGCHA